MKVWVTGANGMLGSALQQTFAKRGISFSASSRSEADLSDPSSLERFYRMRGPFTHLINCAAYTKVDQAEKEPEEAWKVNAQAPAILGRLAAEEGMRMLHLSTDYVFDGKGQTPYAETDVQKPATVYGKTKAEGEAGLLETLSDACIVRTSWIFAPTGRNFVTVMLNLMRQKERLQVVSDQLGRPTYAPDLAEALVGALDWQGIYHLANEKETSWHAFALAIHKEARDRGMSLTCARIDPISTAEYGAPAPRPLYSVLDTSKADLVRGRGMRSWREALKECLDDA